MFIFSSSLNISDIDPLVWLVGWLVWLHVFHGELSERYWREPGSWEVVEEGDFI